MHPERFRRRTAHRLTVVVALAATGLVVSAGLTTVIPGGGAPRSDCYVVLNVQGTRPLSNPKTLECTDGDPSCDTDGTCNDACILTVQLCINQPGMDNCTPPPALQKVKVKSHPATLTLNAPGSRTGPECGAFVDVNLPIKVNKKGQKHPAVAKVRASAKAVNATKPLSDSDIYALKCLPRVGPCPPTTTIQPTTTIPTSSTPTSTTSPTTSTLPTTATSSTSTTPTSTTSSTSTTTSSTSSTTSTTLGDQCATGADCPPTGNECIAATCTGSPKMCGVTFLDQTHAVSNQTLGDCQKIVCDGAGGTVSVDDPIDLPFSNTVCDTPSCVGHPLVPVLIPAPTGTDCTADDNPPNHVCGNTASPAAGRCVECNTNADCSGGTSCSDNTCVP
jgi:hypothetical protein